MELILTLALLLLLAGAVILSFGSLDRHTRLEEGALQVETLFRYARAQSASTGRQVRIVFSSDRPETTGGLSATNAPPSLPGTNVWVQVLWEPDPVEAPGRFEALPGAALLVEQVNDLVTVHAAGQPGSVSIKTGNLGMPAPLPSFPAGDTNAFSSADVSTNTMPPLTCYPDGSSDSMEILLAAADSEDPRLALVRLSGLSGRTSHRILALSPDGNSLSTEDDEALWPGL